MQEVIKKTRTRGLMNIHAAEILKNTKTEYEAATPVHINGAISMKITDNFATETTYSEDGVEEVITEYIDSDIEMEINRLAPQERELFLGQLFKNGFLMKSAEDIQKELALSWMSKLANGLYEFSQYYCLKFNQGDEVTYNTKADKVETQTNSLKGKAYNRKLEQEIDGKKKHLYANIVDEEQLLAEHTDAKQAIESWFSAVQEPALTAGVVATGLTVASAAGTAKGKTTLTVTPDKASGNTYKYKSDVTVAMPSINRDLSGWTAWDGTAEITATTGNDIVVSEVDSKGLCKKAGKAIVIAKA